MTHMRRSAFFVLILLSWVAVPVLGQEPVAETPAVETAAAEYRTLAQERVFDADVEAVRRSTVSAQTSGRITEINFDVDDFVKSGAVLVRFRDTEQRAALQSAEARFNEAKFQFERTQDLLKKNLVAQAAFDRAEADLKAARANLQLAQEQLEHTVVRAPYSGIVTERHVELGETASPGQPLMTGLSLDALRLSVTVPQAAIEAVRQHRQARVILDGRETIVTDRLTFFPYADPASRTFRVRVPLPEGVEGLYPGMFAKVAFTVGETSRLVIPQQALARRSEVTGVYVIEPNDRISLRQVRVGQELNGEVEVLAGLAEGERVALDPVAAAVLFRERAEIK